MKVLNTIEYSFNPFLWQVDLSLVPGAQCEASLKTALNSRQPGTGDR